MGVSISGERPKLRCGLGFVVSFSWYRSTPRSIALSQLTNTILVHVVHVTLGLHMPSSLTLKVVCHE